MFVRRKKNKSGSTSIQIIQKINGINRVIKSVGCSTDKKEIEALYHKALYELPRLYGPTLFDQTPSLNIETLTNDSIRVVGPDIVFGKIYDKIGYNSLNEPILKHLVISRITHPGSKLKLAQYLTDTGNKTISVYSIYRFLDKLNNRLKDTIEEITFNYTKTILGGHIGFVFYDITTIYFESGEPDDFRITGFSKEGKHQNPQILLGLLVGTDGYPIGYDVFEGNLYEGHTMLPVLERFINKFKIDKPIVIADSGLLNKSNIDLLIEKGYGFILGARIKNEKQQVINQIMDLNLKEGELKTLPLPDGLLLHIGYSEKRARKDAFNRERGIKKLRKQITSGRLTKSNINNRGYNKFLKLSGDVQITIDEKKLTYDQRWDGLKGYITNTNLTSDEIIHNYNQLWKIEKAFRISKTDLKIRPIYHRLKERIEAHICVSFMSYLMYKELDRVLNGSGISILNAIEQINKMYELKFQGNSKVIRLKNNIIQDQIMQLVNSNF
jgi:transposase